MYHVTTLKIKLLGELELGLKLNVAQESTHPQRARILEAGSGATLTINRFG